MNILVLNNRNIMRTEVGALVRALSARHKVAVAYMAEDAPYKGQAFSYQPFPIRVNYTQMASGDIVGGVKKTMPVYEFHGFPADMSSIMLAEIMSAHPPDLVICGISNGVNMGPNIYSSSNIGMAMEASYYNIPIVVVGTYYKEGGHALHELEPCVKFVEKNLETFTRLKQPKGTFLNINIPKVEKYSELKGVRFTPMGKMNIKIEYIEKEDSKGQKYYWSKLASQEDTSEGEDTDKYWYDKGYVVVTPICGDTTDNQSIEHWGRIVQQASEKVNNAEEVNVAGEDVVKNEKRASKPSAGGGK